MTRSGTFILVLIFNKAKKVKAILNLVCVDFVCGDTMLDRPWIFQHETYAHRGGIRK